MLHYNDDPLSSRKMSLLLHIRFGPGLAESQAAYVKHFSCIAYKSHAMPLHHSHAIALHFLGLRIIFRLVHRKFIGRSRVTGDLVHRKFIDRLAQWAVIVHRKFT